MRDATLITTQSALDAAVFRMQATTRLAIDTEFMRERTYFPQLCLLQIATETDCFLIDPLAGLDLGALHELMADGSRLKILHAARQDLEVLLLVGGTVPAPVFDTQVAAALLGFAPQIGYAELVARQLGHSIDKGQTRTDWSRRPLSPEQLAYAADDVHHLLTLHTDLAAVLEAKRRGAWAQEETAGYANPALYRTDPAEAWRRLKGLGRMGSREQAAARALTEWRERRAIESDKPRGWILTDEALLAMATLAPDSIEGLEGIRALPPAVIRKRGEELLQLLAAARSGAAANAAADVVSRRPAPEETALATKFMQIVRVEAEALGVGTEVLATRRDIEALAQGSRDNALTRGWRRAVIGEKLLAALG
jgi:ribonuclease D